MDAADIEVSVVIPCLNEEQTLRPCIRLAQQTLKSCGAAGEVLVADNGSTDGSREIAVAEGARLVTAAAKGYGNALHAGFKQARGRYFVFLDADMSYDFTQIPRFLEKLREGADLVMGSRFRGKIVPSAMPFLHRYLGTPVLTMLVNMFFGSRISDVNCGMRGLRKEAFEKMGLRAGGMEFASELLIKSLLLNMSVAEVATDLYPDRRAGRPHLRSWRDGWRHLRFMLLFCPTWLFLIPGLAMTLGGVAVIIAVMLDLLPRTGLLTSMLGLAATVLGAQVTFLGVAARRLSHLQKWHARNGPAQRLLARFTLEKGLVGGAGLALAGLVILVCAGLHIWRFMTVAGVAAGVLDMPATKLALLGTAFFVAGIQTIFFSFFISLQEIETVGGV